ncbi:unnamed protein product [Euphydryas editha]|uniref:Uncharacterized protein n=1 Tax=Euphydryas editha TaxID=104508 RepID=A0AAU9VAN2_EUPED|nr:unnamed protein product [Euphydryas editha]
MISEFENLSLGGNNAASNHADPFTHTELTPEQQKTLIDIRRRKTELLLEIQINMIGINYVHVECWLEHWHSDVLNQIGF